MDYTASITVYACMASLRRRLGGRVGTHFDLSRGRAVEPYLSANLKSGEVTDLKTGCRAVIFVPLRGIELFRDKQLHFCNGGYVLSA